MNATFYFQSITTKVLDDLMGLACLFYDDDYRVVREGIDRNLHPVVTQCM